MTVNVSLKKSESAYDVLARVVDASSRQIKEGLNGHVYFREFHRNELVDREGTRIDPDSYLFRPNICKIIAAYLKEEDLLSSGIVHYATLLEKRFGVPAIAPGKTPRGISVVGLDAIADRLNSARRKLSLSSKKLRAICPEIEQSQDPALLAEVEELTWLFNDGKKRSVAQIKERLFKLIVERERDILYYVRKHPDNKKIHKCQDDDLLARIRVLEGVFNGDTSNLFANGVQSGISRIRR